MGDVVEHQPGHCDGAQAVDIGRLADLPKPVVLVVELQRDKRLECPGFVLQLAKADQVVYAAERLVKESGDKIGADATQAVQEGIDAVKKVSGGDDVDAITAALDQLNTAQQKAAEELYKGAQAGGTPPPGEPASEAAGNAGAGAASSGDAGAPDDVIDAEVVEDDTK